MAELNKNAALRHAIEMKTGRCSEELVTLSTVNPRRARLLMQSGDPLAWQESSKVNTFTNQQDQPSDIKLLSGFMRSEIKRLVERQGVVEDDVLNDRLRGCESCPHLEKAPDSRLYHLGRRILRPDGDNLCGLCGCFVSEKAKRKAESCPSSMPENPSISRWGEAMEQVEHRLAE